MKGLLSSIVKFCGDMASAEVGSQSNDRCARTSTARRRYVGRAGKLQGVEMAWAVEAVHADASGTEVIHDDSGRRELLISGAYPHAVDRVRLRPSDS